jgi:hypothetical protein
MATVAMAVITGKRQNSHTIVNADRAKIAQSAAIRAFAESLMPNPQNRMQKLRDTLYILRC